ncbi:MAG TPA: hypothetical protein VFG88_09840 [Nocardioidaceae bacterium]|nr:hypothetical protein [Nocardioidaceae bacterium]
MSLLPSRVLSLGTAAYGVFALTRPRHLGAALVTEPDAQARYELLARTYGGRDLAVSALAVFGSTPTTVRTAMLARIAFDLSDAALLSREAGRPGARPDARAKVLAVTLGWAGLNALALLAARRG